MKNLIRTIESQVDFRLWLTDSLRPPILIFSYKWFDGRIPQARFDYTKLATETKN